MWKVPLSAIDLGQEEEHALLRVVRSGWLSMGPETEAFESEFAEQAGAAHAVAVSSGTAALHLALLAAGIGPGDEVLLPALTFVATAHAVLYCGAVPVLADVESAVSPLLDPEDVQRKLTERTRAIVPVHYAGALCDMPALERVSEGKNAVLVEDAAHAVGAIDVGQHSVAACFSFYANKNLVTGEGGMITTNDSDHAETLRRLRSHGMTVPVGDARRDQGCGYDVEAHGFGYRLTELQAALGRVQLRKLPEANRRRVALAERYCARLGELGLTFPWHPPPAHLMVVVLPADVDRDNVRADLKREGIQTSVHYPPIHRLSAFASLASSELPVTNALAPRLLTLPLHARLPTEDVDLVCDALCRSLDPSWRKA